MFTSTNLDEGKTGVYTWDTTAAMTGCLTGLVAITAGCATVEPWAGWFVIGLVAGWVYLGALLLFFALGSMMQLMRFPSTWEEAHT